jgi:oligopeptidase A
MTEPTVGNPLLNWTLLPAFDRIVPEHVEPAVAATLERCGRELDALEAGAPADWAELMDPLERLEDRLNHVWGVAGHLNAVTNGPALRAAYEKMEPAVVAFANRLGQSRPLYDGYRRLRDGGQWGAYEEAQRRVLNSAIREAELAGVGLEGPAREHFVAINKELAELGTRFSNHVLDATKAYAMTLRSGEEVAGLPPSLLEQAAAAARRAGHEAATPTAGPWVITLDQPGFVPFMQHSRRRDLREQLYRAFVTRASSGELNNDPLIRRMLELTREKAGMLGFQTYAEVSLSRKMAGSVDAAENLLGQLRDAARPHAEADLAELDALARAGAAAEAGDLRHWDVPFWAERLREARYDLRDEELRPYFPLPRVLEGLFSLAERLFGIRVTAADGEAPVWHGDVRFFRLRDAGGRMLASFYLDPYSRPAEKRGGAWMDMLVGRSRACAPPGKAVRLPVCYVNCNQTPPVGDKPSLMTFPEVRTLFHEFGHALQHMLTTVDCGPAAGINNIEWDAVELASQFMENWCFDRGTLTAMARHYQTGEPLPSATIDRLIEARTFREGSTTLRQVHFGLVDLELYHRYDPAGSTASSPPSAPQTPQDVQQRVAAETLVMPPLPEDRFLCSFQHIFGGGYAAGYFSYKWSEVLSADAFGAFEEAGLGNEAAIRRLGRLFRDTVLALGGSRHPMEVFKQFRGREPSPEPLLRHCGLT